MGTSGAFGGSGGKAAKDLRDSIADWLDSAPVPSSEPADSTHAGVPGVAPEPGTDQPTRPTTPVDLRPILRILTGSSGGRSDGPGGGGGGARGGGTTGGGSRSGGGVRRSLSSTSRAAGRAGALARAYSAADRATLAEAGLDYDELRALGDIVNIGTQIVEAAFDTRADSTLEDAENREIVADVVTWILEQPTDRQPSPEEIVRKSIELIIVDTVLTEVGDTLRKEPSHDRRKQGEQDIRDSAEIYASQVALTGTGASEQEMATAIADGIRELGAIFGGEE